MGAPPVLLVVLASVAAAVAVIALLAPASGAGRGWPSPSGSGARAAGRRRVALVAGVGLLLFALGVGGVLPARRLVLLAVLAGAVLAGGRLLARRRARREVAHTRGRVLEVCEELGSELVAGRTAGVALARGAQEWPPLAGVAEADRLGADVPEALRTLARRPGAEDLLAVAAAWHVAHRTGQGLGEALARVAADLTAQRSLRRVVEGELASARATARLVAALPLLALAMGSGAGGDPWSFLLDTPLGLACLAGGLALAALGLGWIEAIAAGVDGGRG